MKVFIILSLTALLNSCTHTKTQTTEDLGKIYEVCEKEKGSENNKVYDECVGKVALELTVDSISEKLYNHFLPKKYTRKELASFRNVYLEEIRDNPDRHLYYFEKAKITDRKAIRKIVDKAIETEQKKNIVFITESLNKLLVDIKKIEENEKN